MPTITAIAELCKFSAVTPTSEDHWRPIAGWPYLISREGRVFSLARSRERRVFLNQTGYARVLLADAGRKKQLAIARLVYAAWVGPIPSGLQIDHINSVRHDNRPENLQAVTPSENCRLGGARRRARSLIALPASL